MTTLASKDPEADIARADQLINAALALQPDNSLAHLTKGWLFFAKRQWGQAIAEEETAITEDRNNAGAHAAASFFKMWLGHSENGFAGVETALRLSRAIRTCRIGNSSCATSIPILPNGNRRSNGATSQSRATLQIFTRWSISPPPTPGPVTTRKRRGHGPIAGSLSRLHSADMGGHSWTDDPTFNAQYARIVEGLRKAGLPEGEKKTN